MHKVLIVDDDRMIANIYRNKFSLEGFNAEVAADGQEGLELVKSFKPDAVILDLMLPKLSGIELLTAIRLLPEFKRLPVVVFSNTYLTQNVQEAWKAGATKCLPKGNCNPEQLVKLVQGILHPVETSPTAELQPVPDKGVKPGMPPAREPVQPTSEPSDSDTVFQTKLRHTFIESLPGTLNTLRTVVRSISKSDKQEDRLKILKELAHKIHALIGNAGIAGVLTISHFADPFEALIKELIDQPENITPSALRTIANAVDFLAVLFEPANFSRDTDPGKANILVVDDEEFSRRAVVHALQKGNMKSVSVDDPLAALKLLGENHYDLVLLDVDMPKMNGFELCTKIRTLPGQKATPVVFVTRLNDFKSRADSMISGGTDLIAKPFLFMELAVKALTYVMRGGLAQKK